MNLYMEWSTHDPSGSHRAGHEYISWQFARNHFSKRWNYHLAATIRRTCIRFWTKTTEAMRNCLYLFMKKNWERQCGRRGTSWMFNHRHPFSTFFGTAHRVSRRPGASNKGTTYPSFFRRLKTSEMAKLQGLPKQVIEAVLARSQELPKACFSEAIGDAMSINVVQTMLKRLLDASGLTTRDTCKDFWLQCPADRCHQLSDSLFHKYRDMK